MANPASRPGASRPPDYRAPTPPKIPKICSMFSVMARAALDPVFIQQQASRSDALAVRWRRVVDVLFLKMAWDESVAAMRYWQRVTNEWARLSGLALWWLGFRKRLVFLRRALVRGHIDDDGNDRLVYV